jgi:uncharacterized protein YndB with AHSA1/START domain
MTMTVISEWDAPIERVWALWSDPRKLERWWGPPGYPATMVDFELRPGGVVTYYMTSPEGQRHHGWWRVLEVDAPRRCRIEDGFGESPDDPAPGLPSGIMTVSLHALPTGATRMEVESIFPSREAMEQVLAMGMEEGMKAAITQIDAILAEG